MSDGYQQFLQQSVRRFAAPGPAQNLRRQALNRLPASNQGLGAILTALAKPRNIPLLGHMSGMDLMSMAVPGPRGTHPFEGGMPEVFTPASRQNEVMFNIAHTGRGYDPNGDSLRAAIGKYPDTYGPSSLQTQGIRAYPRSVGPMVPTRPQDRALISNALAKLMQGIPRN
ncbi:MAG TPA: hypothetical protein VIY48_20880 [Candidatus Paceibacterota bacterium]